MSWQVTSFAIVGAVLLGGFAWYERSRPTSQVVALVAALAALAVAGRLAFAAIPNVVATTDIVIFAGYALGPAPGFAVGALAGLVSNFWLGQGPWTPWQMVGWGLCGFLGAALMLGGRDLGRIKLAAACGFAGVAYGALLNFSLMATYGGELSLQRFLALEARAVPFDAAHAIGNVALALVAGPAMVRMLIRFRRRFEWRATGVTMALLLALSLATVLPARAQASETDRTVSWLVSVQNSDGGWGPSLGDASSMATTSWAMLGLEATGTNPLDVANEGKTPVDFLRAHLSKLSSSGDFARTILALEGAGLNAHSIDGRNLVSALTKRRRADGSFEGWPASTAFAVMALRQAGATGGLELSLAWLAGIQNPDGGWGDVPGSPSTPDGTAAVVEAMPSSAAAQRGLAYLQSVQLPDGGFALGGTGSVNSQSTAWVVQGMLAAGADPSSSAAGGKSGLEYLSTLQARDGHYTYSASSDQTPVWVTAEVLAAVAGQAFPVTPPPRKTSGSSSPAGIPSESESPSAAPVTGEESPSSAGDLLKSLRESGSGTAPTESPHSPNAVPSKPSGSSGTPRPGGAGGGKSQKAKPESGDTQAPPATAPFTVSDKSGPSPWTPIGIGLASGALALGGVILLGRRFSW